MNHDCNRQGQTQDSAQSYEARYVRALDTLRRERPEEARAAYVEGTNAEAAVRFRSSREFIATYRALRSAGMAPKAALLDIGAGNGVASHAFASRGLRVVAAEPCTHVEYGTRAVARLAALTGTAALPVSCWGESLPFADNTFDAVYLRQCLHHASDLERVIGEASRVLKVGGLFFAAREHVVSDERQLRAFQANHPMHRMGVPERAHPLRAYLAAMRRASLRPLRVFGPHHFPINLDSASLDIVLARHKQKTARLLGSRLAAIAFDIGKVLLTLRLTGRLLDVARKSPGRLYSFMARKERNQ